MNRVMDIMDMISINEQSSKPEMKLAGKRMGGKKSFKAFSLQMEDLKYGRQQPDLGETLHS
jgi:hypothetical protein